MVKDILILGDPALYKKSEPVQPGEIRLVKDTAADLHDTLMDFRKKYKAGRAMAAPQIGVRKRIIYMNITEPVVFINPSLEYAGHETFELMDDCLSFPGLLVKVRRYKRSVIRYKNMDWEDCQMELEDDLSELLQHEYDHLDGILATMRAVDNKSFFMNSARV
jgi:peptide deformylase